VSGNVIRKMIAWGRRRNGRPDQAGGFPWALLLGPRPSRPHTVSST